MLLDYFSQLLERHPVEKSGSINVLIILLSPYFCSDTCFKVMAQGTDPE